MALAWWCGAVERMIVLWAIAGLALGIVVAVVLLVALIVWLAHHWRG